MEIGIQSSDLRLVGNDVQANATAFSRAVVGTDASVRAFNNKGVAKYGFSNELAHKIYAGSDFFLMPSLFEPCGISQMISERYGTLPIVRETGGLKDTVEPYNEYEKTGTGFSFCNYNAHEMLNTIRYAERIYYDRKRDWNRIIERAMSQDFSWRTSARKYEELYRSLIGE